MGVSVFALIFVFCTGGYEGYIHFAGASVALLGYDELGVLDGIFLVAVAVNENDNVGVLLYGTGTAELGKIRLFAFGLAGNLAQSYNRNIEFTGKSFQRFSHFGNLLVHRSRRIFRCDKTYVVYEYDLYALIRNHAPGHGAEINEFHVRCIYNKQRRLVAAAGRVLKTLEVGQFEHAGTELEAGNVRFLGKQTLAY